MAPSYPSQTDAQLRRFDQSGALLRKVMENAAVGMALVGIDGSIIYCNRAYESMLGLGLDEALGRSAEDSIFPDDRQAMALRLGQVRRGEVEEFSIECRMRHVDGGPIWVLASGSLLRSDTTRRPLYAILQVINTDRQKRAEEALCVMERRWNHALESAGQGVWDHDIPRDDMFYSRMWRRMRGIPDDESVDPDRGKWLARVHPDDVPRLLARIDKQDRGEDGFDTLQYRERHRDGHYVWILSRGRPVEWDANGEALRTIGTDTDITRLKQVEGQLAAEKERLRVTLESIGDGVVSTDADERVQYMNPTAEAMTGWHEADAIGRPLSEIFVARLASTGAAITDFVAECLRSGEPRQTEDDVVLASRDGVDRGVSGTAAPVRADDGQVIGSVLVFKDITVAQELRRELAHSASHDPLTGLPNRMAFGHALAEATRQATTENREHALCFIDLDHFKPVNDRAGHAAGDALLQQVAQVLRRACRVDDFVARLGGDEFVLLLADCSPASAEVLAAKLVAAIAAIHFAWLGTPYRIAASIGIAPISAANPGDPLAQADAACYSAKSEGRGRVVIAGT